MPDRLGLRIVAERDVLLVGVRDLDPPEVEFLAGSAIRQVRDPAAPLPEVLAPLVRDIYWYPQLGGGRDDRHPDP